MAVANTSARSWRLGEFETAAEGKGGGRGEEEEECEGA